MFDYRSVLNFVKFAQERFDLRQDMADEKEIQSDIWNSIELRGTNLWALIFAIIIASVGLNINSTAVIIGAMLISPLMGPLIGFGYGLGIHDFDLVKKSARSLFFAMLASLVVSTIYFLISPLGEAHSEILARTKPTIWDVIIALSGGLTGMIANTRKSKSNVIPGVAIATALMPPLCTAGFGIATFQPALFFGAFYLFFINSIFIAFGSMIIVRILNLNIVDIPNNILKNKLERYIMVTIVLTILPSLFIAYSIVQEELEDQRVKNFIESEVRSRDVVVINKQIDLKDGKKILKLVVFQQNPKDSDLNGLTEKLKNYNLENFRLELREFNKETDPETIKAEILNEVSQKYNNEVLSLLSKQNQTALEKSNDQNNEATQKRF